MRKVLLVCVVVAMVAWVAPAEAQFFFEDFDSYVSGSTIMGQGGWETWAGAAGANTIVTNAQSFSPPNSLLVAGAADIVHQFAGVTTGVWYAKARTYIPSGQTGEMFFIMMNRYDGGTCAGTDCNWSIQVAMCLSGCSTAGVIAGTATNLGGSDVAGTGALPLLVDQWVEIMAVIDLGSNTYSIYYGGALLDGPLPWTGTGDINIANFDLFSNGSSESYMDNIWLDTDVPVELQSFDVE
jgi:hypothetical protein